jgi:hypothetical protein
MPRRTEPLSARPSPEPDVLDPSPLDGPAFESPGYESFVPATPPAPPATASDDGPRVARLSDGVRDLRTKGGKLNLSERTLMIAGGICAPVGILLVFLGWYGASHTPNLYEQIPYMISGGLLGLGLVFLGAFFYFTHWITELVKEHRTQSTALLEAITRLEATVSKEAGNDRLALARAASGNGRSASDHVDVTDEGEWLPDEELVATNKGSMAHRPDCVVVAGKPGLRAVTAADGLVPCKLCDPYATETEAQSLS